MKVRGGRFRLEHVAGGAPTNHGGAPTNHGGAPTNQSSPAPSQAQATHHPFSSHTKLHGQSPRPLQACSPRARPQHPQAPLQQRTRPQQRSAPPPTHPLTPSPRTRRRAGRSDSHHLRLRPDRRVSRLCPGVQRQDGGGGVPAAGLGRDQGGHDPPAPQHDDGLPMPVRR
jgi:hypothetical protein